MSASKQPTIAVPASRVRRADAERNRSAIIQAAQSVFAEHGGAIDVRAIARRSGIGMGTLYRHFPTKDDLLATILEMEFMSWLDAAHSAALAVADPWQALQVFFEQMLSTQADNRALVESYIAIGAPPGDCARHHDAVIDDLRSRCLAAGALRPDVRTADLNLLMRSLIHTVRASGEGSTSWRRLLRICLDGLNSRNTEALS